MTQSHLGSAEVPSARLRAAHVPTVILGGSLSAFLAVSYALCVALGLLAPGWGLHRPWLQFLAGFTWLTWPSFVLGLLESALYGWYAGFLFGWLFNRFADAWDRTPAAGVRHGS